MQTEGRASLSVADPVPRARRSTALLLGVAVVVVLLDLTTKVWIVREMPLRDPIVLFGGWITITYVRNPGAAFSIGTGTTWIFTAVAAVVVVVILRTARRLRSLAWAICLGGLLGGALGNLIDRVFRSPGPFRGYVVDWIEWPNFPVFNLADSAIVCSVIGIVLLTLLGYEMDGSRHGWAARHQPVHPEAGEVPQAEEAGAAEAEDG